MQRKIQPDPEAPEPDLEALLASARVARRLPEAVRARCLARARASLTTPAAPPAHAAPRPHPGDLRLLVAVSVVLAAGALGAAVGVVVALR